MKAQEIVNEYYAAWRQRRGDMSKVRLADDFHFTGPVASFTDAAGFRAMAAQAGAAVRSFTVRHQFAHGDLVCSIVDWEMDPLPGVLTAAEVLRVREGKIVSGELIYDAEDLRRAMSQRVTVNSVDIHASAGSVWDVLGDLAAAGEWTPGVVRTKVVGDLRICEMADGQEVEERISEHDPKRRSFRFTHLRSGLPVRGSGGLFEVIETASDTSTVRLTTTFEPRDAASADEVARMIEGAFGAALTSLRDYVEAARPSLRGDGMPTST